MKSKAKKAAFKSTQFLLGLLMFAALAFVAFNMYKLFQDSERDRSTLAKLSELRSLFMTVTTKVRDVGSSDEKVFSSLEYLDKAVHENWQGLSSDLANESIEDDTVEVNFIPLDNLWSTIRRNIDQIMADKDTILYLHAKASTLKEKLPEMQSAFGDIVDTLIASRAPRDQLVKAQEQLWLIERVGRNIDKMLVGSTEAEAGAVQLSLDTKLFGQVLNGLQKGDRDLGLSQVTNSQALKGLAELSKQVEFIRADVQAIFDAAPALFGARRSADRIFDEAPQLLNEATGISDAVNALPSQRRFTIATAIYAAAAAALCLAMSSALSLRSSRRESRLAAETNERNQDAIMQLMTEIADLADGDLTSNATVTESFTGAIADSLNYTIEQLRILVSRIVNTSEKLSLAAGDTRVIALELSRASESQAKEIVGATAEIDEMTATIDQVSHDASKLGEEAERSVTIAKKGGEVVRGTIDGMDNIREQIQDTSKRIKRLGESSQEIGDIVSLINEIADQTNILALNAAIQASMAGEAGRGFAVVADEVQSLAERSAAATKQIASLVKTIQNDTNEAVNSMEQTTAEVVSGAKLAHNAGGALEGIEIVSADLAALIKGISSSAKHQAISAKNVSVAMHVIKGISAQTLAGTTETTNSVAELSDMAVELSESVTGFKLPDELLSEGDNLEVQRSRLTAMTGFSSYEEELEIG